MSRTSESNIRFYVIESKISRTEESYFKRSDQADCDIFGCGSLLFDQRITYVVNPDFKLVNYKYFLHEISATHMGQKEEMTDIDCGR